MHLQRCNLLLSLGCIESFEVCLILFYNMLTRSFADDTEKNMKDRAYPALQPLSPCIEVKCQILNSRTKSIRIDFRVWL